jgi:hypothetical protein
MTYQLQDTWAVILCFVSSMSLQINFVIVTGRACSTNRGEEKCITDIRGKTTRKETTRKTKTQVGGQY